MSKRKYNTRDLTNHIREMAAEVHTLLDDGTCVTRGEALALLIWRKALGGTEVSIDDEGNETKLEIKPEPWAINLIYDRIEGKTPQAVSAEEGTITAVEQVRDLAKQRINTLASKHVKPPESTDAE